MCGSGPERDEDGSQSILLASVELLSGPFQLTIARNVNATRAHDSFGCLREAYI